MIIKNITYSSFESPYKSLRYEKRSGGVRRGGRERRYEAGLSCLICSICAKGCRVEERRTQRDDGRRIPRHISSFSLCSKPLNVKLPDSDAAGGATASACVCVSKHNSFPVWCQCLSEVEHAVVWNCNFPRRGKNDLCLNLLFLQHLTASCCFHTKFSVRNLSFLALCMQVTLALSHVCAYVCVNVCVCVCDVVSSPSVSLRMCMQVMPLPR